MKDQRVLHLSLKKKPFEVMVSGEKDREYRKPTKWIKSRLFGKGYDIIKFVNGYGSDKPYFTCKYLGFNRSHNDCSWSYSNGLTVEIEDGDLIILMGEIIERGNLKADMYQLQEKDIANIKRHGTSTND